MFCTNYDRLCHNISTLLFIFRPFFPFELPLDLLSLRPSPSSERSLPVRRRELGLKINTNIHLNLNKPYITFLNNFLDQLMYISHYI